MPTDKHTPGERLVAVATQLDATLQRLSFKPPVTHVYQPSVYAKEPYHAYLRQFGNSFKEAVLVGMNPGPWGMAQTGVPFGEVRVVRDWLRLAGPVEKPKNMHPKREILGHACTRSEVSGQRLWGWAQSTFVTPQKFFKRFFVYNWCPLAFMEASGKNRTPDVLPAEERKYLEQACDAALRQVVLTLRAPLAIGIGAFAAKRLAKALDPSDGVTVGQILHPSPASPMANRGWAEQAQQQLVALGLSFKTRS